MDIRSDSELVQEALNGSHDAFSHLVHRYIDAVYGLALSRTEHFHQAQDLSQEAFIEAYVNLHHLKDRTKFPNWLFGITRNLCNRWIVRRRRMLSFDELEHEGMDASRSSRPDEDYARKEIREIVRKSIWALPEKTREAMILFYIDGYSYNDLAAFLGVPVGRVRRRLEYGREKLKGALMDMVEEELRTSKPGPEVGDRITEQIEGLWENLRKALPPYLLSVAAMSQEEITRRHQEIFGALDASLSPEQKAMMKEQGYLTVEDLTVEQREVLEEGAHFHWACELLRPPAFIKDLNTFRITFGNYDIPQIPKSHGKRFIEIFKPHPDGGQTRYQIGIEV